jgi:CheY-like chemotaxis protein
LLRSFERRLILRAELIRGDELIVAHTTSISESSVFVHTDRRCELGESFVVRLSFPRFVDPIELDATVADIKVSTGVGDLQGVTLAFPNRSESEVAQLRALFARLDNEHVPKRDIKGTQPIAKQTTYDSTHVPKQDMSGGDSVAEESSQRAFHVLLVDDSDMIRELFVAAMRRYFQPPFIVDTAADCEQGWALLRTFPYDLTIVDYFLPTSDGSKLVELVRGQSEIADLPVVAISVGGSQAREAFLAAGADIYLDKPIVMRDLLYTLGRLTRGRPS